MKNYFKEGLTLKFPDRGNVGTGTIVKHRYIELLDNHSYLIRDRKGDFRIVKMTTAQLFQFN